MDLKSASVNLGKINRLFANIIENPEDTSDVEKDLMLNYIREFQKAFQGGDSVSVPPPVVEAPKVQAPPPPPPPVAPEPVIVQPPVVEAPKVQAPPPPPVAPEPVIVQPPVVEAPKVQAPPPPPVQQMPPPPAPEPVKTEVKPTYFPPKGKYKMDINNPFTLDEFKDLFNHEQAKDLAQKLQLAPIADLKKAITLNDKLLFINELFDGDATAFEFAINRLNNLNGLEAAKEVMLDEYLNKFGWLDEDEDGDRGIAVKAFVKLVRRRYT